MSAPLNRLPRLLGIALALICTGFVAWRFAALVPQMRQFADWPTLLGRMTAASLIYAIGGFLLAIAWWLLLRTLVSPQLPLATAATGHMRAQLAKYLPGNVFHFALRHSYARQDGMNHITIATAAVAESILLVLVAGLLSAAIPASQFPASMQWLVTWKWLLFGIPLLVLLIGYAVRRLRPALMLTPSPWWMLRGILAASASYLAFFVLSALAFTLLLGNGNPLGFALLPIIAACWLGGFLVIGAPGGIGVREALLVGLLGPSIGEAYALYATLTFRGVTILGDMLVFLMGSIIYRRIGWFAAEQAAGANRQPIGPNK